MLLWAFAWGIGGSLTTQSLVPLEKSLSDIFNSDIYPKGSVFNYFFSMGKPEGDFTLWHEIVPEFEY
jgi:hypothetical protein